METSEQFYYDMVDRYERYCDHMETLDRFPMSWEDWLKREKDADQSDTQHFLNP